jgi:hypothetical protein
MYIHINVTHALYVQGELRNRIFDERSNKYLRKFTKKALQFVREDGEEVVPILKASGFRKCMMKTPA